MSYEVNTNGTKRILKIDCQNCKQNPSMAENPACLEDVIKGLESHANIDRVLLEGRYVREYNDEDISLLKEFIRAHKSSRYLALRKLTPKSCTDCREERKTKIMRTWDEIKRDPKGGLGKLKQWIKELNEKSGRGAEKCKACRKEFLEKGLKRALTKISDNRLIEKLELKGNQKEYEELFHPTTRPSFLRSKLKLKPPKNAELVDAYEVDETQIRIFVSI